MRSKESAPPGDKTAPAFGRKAVLYATCFVNYNNPSIGEATRAVLARNGVETEVLYPRCCAMPQLEQGNLAAVSTSAGQVAAALEPWIDDGWDILALVPSCALMLKFNGPRSFRAIRGSRSSRKRRLRLVNTLSTSPGRRALHRVCRRSTAALRFS